MPDTPMPSIAQNLPDFANADESYSPPPGVLLADYFEENAGYATRRRAGTRDYLIFYTVSGHGRIRLSGKEVNASAGDVTLFFPGTPHDYEALPEEQPWRFYWAHFIARAAWLEWLQLPQICPGLVALPVNDADTRARIEVAFIRLVRELDERRAMQAELAENALAEVLLLVARSVYRRTPGSLDPRVEAIQEYLEQHFQHPVSLADLAGLVSLSPWRVSHLYKSHTGHTITEALSILRLSQAARLLAFTSRTISEIANDVGIESEYYFSRLFKRVYGSSPAQYRKAQRKAE